MPDTNTRKTLLNTSWTVLFKTVYFRQTVDKCSGKSIILAEYCFHCMHSLNTDSKPMADFLLDQKLFFPFALNRTEPWAIKNIMNIYAYISIISVHMHIIDF